jgi:hypothetical protein
MKIFIAGSMSFAKEIIETKVQLKRLGFDSYFAPDTYDCFKNPHLKLNEDLDHCEQNDIIRACMNVQKQCDAILLLNYPKDGVDGYIGSNCLIELGLAYYLKQMIFLLHAPPSPEKARYHVEVMHMKPIILKGNINGVKRYANLKEEDRVLLMEQVSTLASTTTLLNRRTDSSRINVSNDQ